MASASVSSTFSSSTPCRQMRTASSSPRTNMSVKPMATADSTTQSGRFIAGVVVLDENGSKSSSHA